MTARAVVVVRLDDDLLSAVRHSGGVGIGHGFTRLGGGASKER
jgi:hypothetical protein